MKMKAAWQDWQWKKIIEWKLSAESCAKENPSVAP
jgi:hypothetical protein